jgi:hypothetical protein
MSLSCWTIVNSAVPIPDGGQRVFTGPSQPLSEAPLFTPSLLQRCWPVLVAASRSDRDSGGVLERGRRRAVTGDAPTAGAWKAVGTDQH